MIWHGATSSGSCLQNASKPSAMAAAAFMCTCPNDKFTAPLRQIERSWLLQSLNPVRNTAVALFRSNDYSSLLSLLFPQTQVPCGVLGQSMQILSPQLLQMTLNSKKCAAVFATNCPFTYGHPWMENLVKKSLITAIPVSFLL